MAIIAKGANSKNWVPAPEGQHVAVCCDVVDLGIVDSHWQGEVTKKHKARIVFQIEETNPDFDDKPFIVSRQFTLTMHENGGLRPFLESWRGKKYTDEEAVQDFDIEKMVGVPALIQITHNTGNNAKTYANIDSVMRLPKSMKPFEIDGYIRVKDRENGDQQSVEGGSYEDGPCEDEIDDLPF